MLHPPPREGASRTLAFPSAGLRSVIDRYWTWEGDGELPPFLPGTGSELLLVTEGRLFDTGRATGALPAAFHLIPRRHPLRLKTEGRARIVAVRFRSGGLRHFVADPVASLVDLCVPAADLWAEADRLEEIAGRGCDVAGLESFLSSLLRRERRCDAWLDSCVESTYYAPPGASVRRALRGAPVSLRQVERIFSEATGLGPKAFLRNVRFNRVVRAFCLGGRRDLAALALESGYCDQAHFTHDFRTLSGTTPAAFVRSLDRMSLFYNNSRPN